MLTNSVPTDCATSGYKRTIHDPTIWRFLQEVYIESADEARSERYEEKKEHLPSYSGFAVAVEVKDDAPVAGASTQRNPSPRARGSGSPRTW